MENTEKKERFIAQYWGQRVLVDVTNSGEKCTCPVERSNMYRIEESHLELKSTDFMPDEDVLKIAELLPWQKTYQESSIIAQTREILDRLFQTNLNREQWSEVLDKIRELGYAHKWNGISVKEQIEMGWIKLKNAN